MENSVSPRWFYRIALQLSPLTKIHAPKFGRKFLGKSTMYP